MTPTIANETVEAVILNGPRKGQIISFSEEEADTFASEQESQLVQAFLEQVDIMARNVSEMRARIERITSALDRLGDDDGSR